MCGILIAARSSSANDLDTIDATESFEDLWGRLKVANAERGPDASRTVVKSLSDPNDNHDDPSALELRLFASELRLRGTLPVEQPHVGGLGGRDTGNVFCWNGEAFEGLDLTETENDGSKLYEHLESLNDPKQITDVFARLEGPYAFTYFHTASERLYFGRDPLGRRSLLIHKPTTENPYFILVSVSVGVTPSYDLEELSTEHIWCLALKEWRQDNVNPRTFAKHLHVIPRNNSVQPEASSFFALGKVNDTLPDAIEPPIDTLEAIPAYLKEAVDGLLYHLSESVRLRVRDVPFHGLNGGARVAVLFSGGIDSTILAYLADRHLPPDEPIDLLNVAFENPRKIQVQKEACSGFKQKKRKQIATNLDRSAHAAFSYLVPDRVTGLEELEELRRLCPRRPWNFVEVNVSFAESSQARSIVEALMFPSRTVMDMSLGLALYFASRGVGQARLGRDLPAVPYTSSARVLLNGLGSDELLGGYGRHRTAFNAGGWEAVIKELQQEIDRIPTRNLGRDDRIISSHGKETRHPFLSLSVVNFLVSLPVHYKVDPRGLLGVGDKMLLRLVARKEGLVLASQRKKRAMQFGSHSARMDAGEDERRGDIMLNP